MVPYALKTSCEKGHCMLSWNKVIAKVIGSEVRLIARPVESLGRILGKPMSAQV